MKFLEHLNANLQILEYSSNSLSGNKKAQNHIVCTVSLKNFVQEVFRSTPNSFANWIPERRVFICTGRNQPYWEADKKEIRRFHEGSSEGRKPESPGSKWSHSPSSGWGSHLGCGLWKNRDYQEQGRKEGGKSVKQYNTEWKNRKRSFWCIFLNTAIVYPQMINC